jgi:hypothetical protein
MSGENRTDFLPHNEDSNRKPAEIDFTKPETANWAEIQETIKGDPELKSDLEDALARSLKRRDQDPKFTDRIVRIAVILGLTFTALGAARYINESRENQPDYKPTESAAGFDPSQEQKETVANMKAQTLQEEAQEYFDTLKARDTAEPAPTEIPNTVKDQNFDELDTTKIE